MTDEELDRLLAAPPPLPAEAAWLAASTRRLPRPRPWGLLGLAAGLLAGLAAGWFLHGHMVPPPAPKTIERIVEVPAPALSTEQLVDTGPMYLTHADLDRLEAKAELAEPEEAARLYRQAGDLYLRHSDYASAARCYRLHLEAGGKPMLKRNNDDSWLLASMKPRTDLISPEDVR